MTHDDHLYSPSDRYDRRLLLPVFLFLATSLYFVYHNQPAYSKVAIGDYNQSADAYIADVNNGSLVRQVSLLSLGCFAVVSLIRHRASLRIRVRGSLAWTLLGFTIWAFLSCAWAGDIALTLRRLAVFGIFVIASLAVARRFSSREVVLWCFFCTTMFLIIAIVAEAAYGNFQPFVAGYRFAGPTQPNNQACDCALLVLGALAAADVERRWRIYFRFAAIIGFAFLILTQSRTGIGAMLAALVAYFTAVLPRPARIAIACVLSLVCCVALFFYIFGTFGKIERAVALGRTDDDSSIDSFNGRAGVWRDVAPYILDRPLIGYGYGGFWTAARISHISDEEGWPIRDSHSAYVEYLCTLGVIGALAYVSMLLTGIWRAFGFFRVTHNPSFAFYGALLIFCALSGFLEGVASDPSLMMFLSMVVLTQLAFGPFRIGDERTLTAWPR